MPWPLLTFTAALAVRTHLIQVRARVRNQGSLSQIVRKALLVVVSDRGGALWRVLLAICNVAHRSVTVLVQALVARVQGPPICRRWCGRVDTLGLHSLNSLCRLLLFQDGLGPQIIRQRARGRDSLLLLQQRLRNGHIRSRRYCRHPFPGRIEIGMGGRDRKTVERIVFVP